MRRRDFMKSLSALPFVCLLSDKAKANPKMVINPNHPRRIANIELKFEDVEQIFENNRLLRKIQYEALVSPM